MDTKREAHLDPENNGGEQRIVIEQRPPRGALLGRRLLMILLGISVLANILMYSSYQQYFSETKPLPEKFHSGAKDAEKKIAVIRAHGVLMGENSEYVLKQVKQAREDENVVAVVLEVDSPGGLVSDSHRIYHKLNELHEAERPIVVSMKTLAASGGYYIAMGAGSGSKIYAEPTTWTGSIGVLFPRYEAVKLINNWGIEDKSLATGPLKNAGSLTRPMDEAEREQWEHVINDAFEQFLTVVGEGRSKLAPEQIRSLATGQVFTADDALGNGLVDEIGFLEDAIDEAKRLSGEETVRVVTYSRQPTPLEVLTGTATAPSVPGLGIETLLELSVPRAMYIVSWGRSFAGALPGSAR